MYCQCIDTFISTSRQFDFRERQSLAMTSGTSPKALDLAPAFPQYRPNSTNIVSRPRQSKAIYFREYF